MKILGGCRNSPTVFISKSTISQYACVHKEWGLTADLRLGRRPVAGAALAERSWETGGRHPNVITAAKLLSTKRQITEICTPRLPDNENRGAFEQLLHELRSAVEVVLHYVLWDSPQKPQLLADFKQQHWELCGKSYGFWLYPVFHQALGQTNGQLKHCNWRKSEPIAFLI